MRAADENGPRAFGNAALVRDGGSQRCGWPTLDNLWREVRYALRNLRRTPVATLAAIASLGRGIGVLAVVFSGPRRMPQAQATLCPNMTGRQNATKHERAIDRHTREW